MITGKPFLLLSAQVDSRSGYGQSSRDFAQHLIALDKYDVKIVPIGWGACPNGVLKKDNPKDKLILDRIQNTPLTRQPDIFVQVAIPNEFQPIGKYNIGYTAGIETTLASPAWIEGCNRMNLVLVTSEHSKTIFESTTYNKNDPNGHQIGTLKLEKPVEVLHNCADTNIYKKTIDVLPIISEIFDPIVEKFGFLFVGHWLQGEFGQDRKNVGMLIKVFLETFKNTKKNKPFLMLKTSGANFSLMDREDILSKIEKIKSTVASDTELPSVYLVHGELTDEEMNGLYNHPKIKAHVSFTRGEGFGMPLLEASLSMKPVIASGWSGQLDFLNKEESVLVGGKLEKVHPSAVWEGVIEKDSSWFTVDYPMAANALMYTFMEQDKLIPLAKKLGRKNRELFSYSALQKRLGELMTKYVPPMAVAVPFILPKLRKIGVDDAK